MGDRQLHVLIVGGGIGGLCLANGLKKSGVSVALFERDRSAQFRRQGYRIHINHSGGHALRECLSDNIFNLVVATSGKSPTGKHAEYDAGLNEVFSMPLRRPAADSPAFFQAEVNRLTLREIMLAELGDVVNFDKTLVGLEHAGTQDLRAVFADGTHAEGHLVVGADGTGSATRRLLLPEARITDLGFAIYGKTPLTPQTLTWIPEDLTNGFSRVSDSAGVAMMFGVFRKQKQFVEAAATYAPGLRLTETDDYLMWTFRATLQQLDLTNQQLGTVTSDELHVAIARLTEEWHPLVRRILASADIPAIFPVRFGASEPIAPWSTGRVTLLGDAVHTMPPFRGVGANTALQDAELLHRALVDVVRNGVPLAEAVNTYETSMLKYGFEAVTRSVTEPLFRKASQVREPPEPGTKPHKYFNPMQ